MPRPRVSLALVGLVSLALAACTDAGGPAGQGSTSTTVTAPSPGSTSSTSPSHALAKGIAGARPGGTLTVLSGHPYTPSMDPTAAYYTSTISILSGLLVRSLTQYVYDPDAKTMVLTPDLATDLGHPNRDYTVWTFELRQGIRYENGQLVTPADVKFGIERSFDRTTFPDGAAYSNEYFLHGDTYQGPYRSPGPYPGVEVSGQTITLRMARPFPDLPYWLSFPAMSPIPRGAASNPATYEHHPWATGPYLMEQYSPGRSLVLTRNPFWDPATDPGRHQYVDRFVFDFTTPIDHRTAQRVLSDTGTARHTIVIEDLQPDDYQAFLTQAPGRLVLGTLPCTSMLYPDSRTIRSVAVRRALAYAYPYRAGWRIYGLVPGVSALPATGTIPLGVPGRLTYNPLPAHPPSSTQPLKARALLRRAGQLGFPIRFAYQRDVPEQVQLKSVLVSALRRAGFRPVPVATTSTRYTTDILRNPDAPVNVRSVGWCADWPSSGPWTAQGFGTIDPTDPPGFDQNFAHFSQPAVDARIQAIQRLPLDRQPTAWTQLERTIEQRWLPVIPLRYFGVVEARGSLVHNDVVDPIYGLPVWKDIWLGAP